MKILPFALLAAAARLIIRALPQTESGTARPAAPAASISET